MANQTTLRISREVNQIQKGHDLSLAIAYQDSDLTILKALIVGPPSTPYEYGFFEFLINVPNDYPSKPPKVEARTTNAGRCRFGPNIYASGKVCLSILGTWRGETSGDVSNREWSSAQGLESILWSIQSLMSDNPYENEPGYEHANNEEDKKSQAQYIAKIRHETIRIAVIQKLEAALGIQSDGAVGYVDPDIEMNFGDESDDDDLGTRIRDTEQMRKFEPFNDLYKRRFLWYYATYLSTVDRYEQENQDHTAFTLMPFEHKGNEMNGKFQYSQLKTRLERVKELLDEETAGWAKDGLLALRQETGTAANLQRQFEQIVEHHKIKSIYNLNMELEEGNPFVWIVTYFGKPMTDLGGGVFKIKISISPKFPAEQPRVRFETRIYHHRVAKDGTLCYLPSKKEDMQNHLESIVDALESTPPYDPRSIVHPEATKLLWGSEDDKKRYHRLLRRSAEASTEDS